MSQKCDKDALHTREMGKTNSTLLSKDAAQHHLQCYVILRESSSKAFFFKFIPYIVVPSVMQGHSIYNSHN
jgi:hypothetical protein